jgi:ribosomal-protein-alanine N-acetyltransferase
MDAPLVIGRRRLLGWCFDRGLQRIALQHSTQNHPSCRVAEKAGYALEGTLRSVWQLADGRHDVHLHARINSVDR